MKTIKALILAVTAGVLLIAVQLSSAATNDQNWDDSVHDSGPGNTKLYTATSGATTPDFDNSYTNDTVPDFVGTDAVTCQSDILQENDKPQTFGYSAFNGTRNTVFIAEGGNPGILINVDMGLDPAAALDVFSSVAGIPATNSDTHFVRYGHAEGLENNALAGDFIAGPLTPIAELNDFQNGQDSAVYFGSTSNNESFASVTANFGTGTWSGIILGPFDVAVSGVIEGQFFTSDTIAGFRDNSTPINGRVAGIFYGPAAEEIAGVIDINRNGERIVDLFDNQKVYINLPAN